MSAFNQAAFDLAAFSIAEPEFIYIQSAGSERIAASAQIAAAIKVSGVEQITGTVLIAACTSVSGLEEITGSTQIAAAIESTGIEEIAGTSEIGASIRAAGAEEVTAEAYPDILIYVEPDGSETVMGWAEIAGCVAVSASEIIDAAAVIDPGRGILPIVRARMGIYYSDPHKNLEIWQLILEAKEDLITSGWPEPEMISGCETEMAITAICVHVLQNVGEIDDDHAFRILRGLQTKASIRKAKLKDEEDRQLDEQQRVYQDQ